MPSWEFSFCFFISYAYISTCIRRHLKETIPASSITWSKMGKQNIQAKEVYRFINAIYRIFHGFASAINPVAIGRTREKLGNHEPEASDLQVFFVYIIIEINWRWIECMSKHIPMESFLEWVNFWWRVKLANKLSTTSAEVIFKAMYIRLLLSSL